MTHLIPPTDRPSATRSPARRRWRCFIIPPKTLACRLAAPILISLALAACQGDSSSSKSDAPPGDNPSDGAPPTAPTIDSNCPLSFSPGTRAPIRIGPDPRFSEQWYLSSFSPPGGNTVQENLGVLPVWEKGIQGNHIRIAIVDVGVETSHEDLFENFVDNSSFNYRTGKAEAPLPCEKNETHGTFVAGVIAARSNNGVGISGIAPHVKMVSYNALATSLDADIIDALSRDSTKNDIYNNSWGGEDGTGLLVMTHPLIENAIIDGIRFGRRGLGSIYVFSAGNGGCYGPNGSCVYHESSNYDNYVNNRGTIPVCAIDQFGKKLFYSESGANLVVCGYSSFPGAPPGVITTGINNTYTSQFSGTSAAAPMISGVIALMLQANKNLTWRDIPIILARTARQNDPSDAGWKGAGIPAGGGLPFNHNYGFGVVNTLAAVEAATHWESVGTAEMQKKCHYDSKSSPQTFPLTLTGPSNEDSISVTDSSCDIQKIELVEIGFSSPESHSGNFNIKLVSPHQLTSQLASARKCTDPRIDPTEETFSDKCGTYDDWTFRSFRHLDESPQGTWKLVVNRADTTINSEWSGWSLTLWGH